ncbi:AAA family ATPase [Thermocrinis minervae]|uniref:DNA repair protein RecN n=1 Tax=Thermocrinis minervae TaxID=381751 RepID=A0A1M6R8V2_9AQUI|nr:AAA family ATPase [Thermocrinis minervae]SHK28891.1 DNA repair protein RecN (Recombination protein N) [Thermocrinis minervae]
MLHRILLENFAFFKAEEVEFSTGLNVITGESGAGKSLLLKSLLFLMGDDGDYQEGTAVEAYFQLGQEETVIRREVKNSRSRYYINGRGSSQKTVKDLLSQVILLQGQDEKLKITRQDFQRDLFDRFVGALELRKSYEEIYLKVKSLEEEIASYLQSKEKEETRIKLLEEEIKSIERIGLSWDEYLQVKSRLEVLSEADKVNRLVEKILDLLLKEGGVLESLSKVKKLSEDLSKLYPEFEAWTENLSHVLDLLTSFQREVQNKRLDLSQEEIDRLNELVFQVQILERRYRKTYKEILEYVQDLKEELKRLRSSEEKIEESLKTLEELRRTLQELGKVLTEKRLKGKKTFEDAVMGFLRELGLERSVFTVDMLLEEGRYGKERVVFKFSSYGGDAGPLDEVPSGGELSRLALSLFLISPPAETYILDEVDTGLSGQSLLKFTKLLKKLSKNTQVIVISHSPLLASAADRHIRVRKEYIGDMPIMMVEELEGEERLKEIARLMGKVSESTIQSAKELIRELSHV